MSSPRHYVPTIRRFLISVLYHEARHKGVPMTTLVNELLENALAESIGWQRATEALKAAGTLRPAKQGQ
jgi:hypothetical protein